MATATEEKYIYTEIVFRDDDGNEVGRERQYDDAWWDTGETREMTEDERMDYLDEDEEE